MGQNFLVISSLLESNLNLPLHQAVLHQGKGGWEKGQCSPGFAPALKNGVVFLLSAHWSA
jgi:hypothetical protein